MNRETCEIGEQELANRNPELIPFGVRLFRVFRGPASGIVPRLELAGRGLEGCRTPRKGRFAVGPRAATD